MIAFDEVVFDPKYLRHGKTLAQGVQSKLIVVNMLSVIWCRGNYSIDRNADVKSVAGPATVPYLSEDRELARQDQDFDSDTSP